MTGDKERAPDWYEQPDVPVRLREIVRLRDVGLYNLQHRSTTEIESSFFELDEAARSILANHAVRSVVKRLRTLMEAAVREIPSQELQSAARCTFGLAPEPMIGSSKERRDRAASAVRVSFDAWRKNPQHERSLLLMIDNFIDAVVAANRVSIPGSSDFVERSALRAQFDEALAAQSKYILFYGEGGTGKTRIAQELTRPLNHVFIQAYQTDLLHEDIARVLEGRERRVEGDNSCLRRAFKNFLSSEQAPEYLVMDGVQDVRELDLYVPEDVRATVIVTARRKISYTQGPIRFIKVEALTENESISLLDMYFSQSSRLNTQVNKRILHRFLYGRVLAIKQAAAFLGRYANVAPWEFAHAAHWHAERILAEVAESDETNLVKMYENVFSELSRSEPVALRILQAMSFTDRTVMTRLIAGYAANELRMGKVTIAIQSALIEEKIKLLEDLCLIQRVDDGRRVSIEPLTQMVFRGLLRPHADGICSDLLSAIRTEDSKLKADLLKACGTEEFSAIRRNFLSVNSELQNQSWEVSRVRALVTGTEVNKLLYAGALRELCQTKAIESREVMDRNPTIGQIQILREAMLLLPRGLRTDFGIALWEYSDLREKIIEWSRAHGGVQPF